MKTNDSILQNILKKSRPYEDGLIEDLKDPEMARAFLNASLEAYKEDGNETAYLRAVRYVTKAQGGIDKLYDLGRIRRERKKEAVGV